MVLADGRYEAIVVDAEADTEPDVITLSLAITTGDEKGNVVEVKAMHLQYDPLELLAVPCVLGVADGIPSVIFD